MNYTKRIQEGKGRKKKRYLKNYNLEKDTIRTPGIVVLCLDRANVASVIDFACRIVCQALVSWESLYSFPRRLTTLK